VSFEFYEQQLRELETAGMRRTLSDRAAFNGLNLSSNDYLGLSKHPSVKEAAARAILEHGTGGTSSRLLAGTFSIHAELENELASFLKKEAALVFSSGYHTNTGLIPVLAGPGDVVFVDRLSHASIIDGVKLSAARFHTFEHNNLADLERLLKEKRGEHKRALVITEGVFSMDGDQPDLRRLSALVHAHDALLYVDEAHSIGVFGEDGRGWASEQGVLDQVDILVGTLSKTLASQGGFVASRRSLIDFCVSRCRSFIYTTALFPAAAAAALCALRLFPSMKDRRALVLKTAADLRASLNQLGYKTFTSTTQIIPVWTGDVAATLKLSRHLFDRGFFVPSIRPPTVPAGEGRVRLSITHDIAAQGITNLIQAFERYEARFVTTH
jgi:8-amino-7-oxononanoate synthase